MKAGLQNRVGIQHQFSPDRILAYGFGFACSLVLLLAVLGCAQVIKPLETKKGEVVNKYPHDPTAFTQGLVFYNGYLYEGTGQKGRSLLRKVKLEDGKDVVPPVPLSPDYFGEGITILNDKIYQLTWQDNYCLVYDVNTLELLGHFVYEFEGWGLTTDGNELILSDGTPTIRFIDPETFKVTKKLDVTDRRQRLKSLNELEWIDGEIWANIWYEDRIARISPDTGAVLGWVDLQHIYPQNRRHRESVMNGIAYDPDTKRIFVTGKNWPHLFEIRIPK
ncbi:glutaminyl-peptide cyclotransferase [Pirellulaceae bacterium SH449]